ncbi:MAG TPA: alpha-L-fucosidase, partial [Chitinophagaceae bacterium]|nr:alpha-L-fucosidase [Chitinophagaceae bacterium]
MKYITITSKHHDGFAMFKSYATKYNIVDATPYGKDVIKALSDECHKQGIKMCFYYSQSRDWNEPNGLDNDWDFPKERDFQKYLDEKVKPQLTELLTNYGEVGMIWFDTPISISKEQAQSLKDLVRKLQPACIISGRLGGGVETDYKSAGDNSIPATVIPGDWEVPATLNNTWGFRKTDHNWKSPEVITRLLFDIASKGGNYLLNVGPDANGVIPAESVKILEQVGQWMKVNHDAIYGTKASPWAAEFDWGNITRKPGKLYLGIYNWPNGDFYLEGLKNKVKKIYLLSNPAKPITYKESYSKETDHHRLKIDLPKQAPDKIVSVVVLETEGDAEVEPVIAQQNDGRVKLPGAVAAIKKDGADAKLNFVSHGGGAEGWTDPKINLAWSFTVDKPGVYNVDIVTTETGSHEKPAWLGGHTITINCEGQQLQPAITADSKEYNPRTQYWQKIHTKGGTVRFSKPGTYHLSLTPEKFAEGREGFTFREINLIPAAK